MASFSQSCFTTLSNPRDALALALKPCRHEANVRQTYAATTSMSGSIVRSKFSMPRSVPEIELGHVPHAPW